MYHRTGVSLCIQHLNFYTVVVVVVSLFTRLLLYNLSMKHPLSRWLSKLHFVKESSFWTMFSQQYKNEFSSFLLKDILQVPPWNERCQRWELIYMYHSGMRGWGLELVYMYRYAVNLPATLSSTCLSPSSEYLAKSNESNVCMLEVLAEIYQLITL